MNSFSDEDLKRLKEWATDYPYVTTNKDFDKVVACIARLEAAEAALLNSEYQEANDLMDAWYKSKGEGDR